MHGAVKLEEGCDTYHSLYAVVWDNQLTLGFPWLVETALCIDLRERKQEGATC